MKSLGFFKPTLAATLAIVLAWLLSVRAAQAGYTVTLQEVGPDVVATGGGKLNLTGLTLLFVNTLGTAQIQPNPAVLFTGLVSGNKQEVFRGLSGPMSFGSKPLLTSASSSSGDLVGIVAQENHRAVLSVPRGYISGTSLSDRATYRGKTLAKLGVTPGTYVWKWATGPNQKFTLQILPATNITNFSARASVQTGQEVTIVRFIITGTALKQVVVRGLGPSLTQSGLSGALADPTLQLLDGTGKSIFINDNWKETQQADIQATGLAPTNDAESAIRIALQPGNYTAVLSGKNNTTGVGLVEVYDIEKSISSAVTNVSCRGFVGSDDNVLIAGFIASGGDGSTEVLVRGLGPTLTQYGVSGTLADPVVTLVDHNGNIVQTNNNWKDTQPAAISATGKAPPNNLEAAILATVAAGNYTAILSGNGGGTGIGLVEVYKLP